MSDMEKQRLQYRSLANAVLTRNDIDTAKVRHPELLEATEVFDFQMPDHDVVFPVLVRFTANYRASPAAIQQRADPP